MTLAESATKSLRSPVARGMLDFFTGSVWQVGFARSLSFHDAAEVTSVSPQGMEMVYRVPENICVKRGTLMGDGSGGRDDRAFLPCGVTTALFDEVSTLAMVMADRTYRPGVSISLSCHTFHPVGPGEMGEGRATYPYIVACRNCVMVDIVRCCRVTFKSRGLKMGARLGYGEASMYREDGKLAARGRHVKYLPMGRFWDMAANPLFFRLSRKASDLQHAKWLRDPERTKGIPAGQHLMDMFKLEEFERYDSDKSVAFETHTPNGQQGEGVGGDGNAERGGTRSAEAQILVTRRQCNYMPGTLHGGALAVAAEEIARRCPPPSLIHSASASARNPAGSFSEPNPRVQYMEVHYMSAIKRRAGLAAVSTSVEGKGMEVTRVGLSEAGGVGGGALCAEAVLLWGESGSN